MTDGRADGRADARADGRADGRARIVRRLVWVAPDFMFNRSCIVMSLALNCLPPPPPHRSREKSFCIVGKAYLHPTGFESLSCTDLCEVTMAG